jgi:hypothetical protein
MSEAAKAAGIGPDIEFRGKRYRLKEKTPEMVGLLEVWLQGRAWDALERNRGVWPQNVFDERQDRLMAAIAAGAYSWGSRAMATALSHPEGIKESMYLAMLAEDRSITRELVEEIFAEEEAKALSALERVNAPDPTTGREPAPASV